MQLKGVFNQKNPLKLNLKEHIKSTLTVFWQAVRESELKQSVSRWGL